MKYIPETLPQDMQSIAGALHELHSQDECLRKAYDILTKKYYGNRIKTLLRFFDLFPRSLNKLWSKNGFLHCTNFNWLLRILLIKSGHFTEKDVTTCWTLLWFVSPHQFIRVTMENGQKINIDLWAAVYGIPFGDYAHGFHAYGNI